MKHFASILVAAVATAQFSDMNVSVNGDDSVFKIQSKDWSNVDSTGG